MFDFLRSYIDKEQRSEFIVTLNQWKKVCGNAERRNRQPKRVKKMEEIKKLEFYYTNDYHKLCCDEGAIALLKVANSSQISGIGCRGTILYVRFKTGAIYSYDNVPLGVAALFFHNVQNEAFSVGTYFNVYVKRGGYHFNKIPEDSAIIIIM